MSFDLKIEGNDLTLGANGDIAILTDNNKLSQEIIKAIITPLGSNRFFKWYGSTIGAKIIGKVLPYGMAELEAQRSIEDTINNIVALKKAQSRVQYVSPAETIANIQEISVLRSLEDPRQFEVVIVILTRQLTEITETFAVRI